MRNKKSFLFITICTVPAMAMFILFFIYPIAQSFIMALYKWSGLTVNTQLFIGLKNFRTLFKDETFWISVRNNFELMLIVPVSVFVIAMVFAVMLTRLKLRERGLYRTVFFFPNVLSEVVISILWIFIYHPTLGILNSLLGALRLDGLKQQWLGNPKTALISVAVVIIWSQIGFYMVLFMAGIENIPVQLYEAATVDGAGQITQFFRITLPLLWEVIRVSIIFLISHVFYGCFTYIKIMTNGGPDRSTLSMTNYLYNQAFVNYNMGYATAVGVFIFLIGFILAIFSERVTKKETIKF